MRRENKNDEFSSPINFIIEQSSTMKIFGLSVVLFALLSAALIIFNMDLENIKVDFIPVYMIPLPLLFWLFVILPYNAINTKKTIIIKNGKFIVESNKKKYQVNRDLEDIVWWRKVVGPEGSKKLQVKFLDDRISFNHLYFKDIPTLVRFLEANYKKREKKMRP